MVGTYFNAIVFKIGTFPFKKIQNISNIFGTPGNKHSGYGLSQWEEALLCNASFHWLSPCPEWSLWPQCGKNQFFQMASYILQGIYKTLKSSLDLASAWLTAFFHLQKQPHSPFFYHMCRWFVAIVWGNVWYNHAPLLSNQIISILGLRINWISLCLKFCSYKLSNFKMNERSCPSHTSQNSIKCKGNFIYSRVFLIWSWHWSINQTDQVF